jgi:hypothetical protein
MNPYIVSRWATRRLGLQNSPDARTSTTAVWTAIVPRPTGLPVSRDLRQFAKKYFALPLWAMSNSTPVITASTISTM